MTNIDMSTMVEPTSPSIPSAPVTILVVDDTLANIGVLTDFLESQDFTVVVAQDGEEGLHRAQYVLPNLILLDVMMPGMDGFEMCRLLKENETTRDIPVIFMTALTDTTNIVTGFDVGGIDYVTKPIEIEEVLVRIRTHLRLQEMQNQVSMQNAKLLQEVDTRILAEQALQVESNKQHQLILQLQEAQNQLLQSEKMASLGQLAAGVAHEINNPIGFVSSNLNSLRHYVSVLFGLIDSYEKLLEPYPSTAPQMEQLKQKADMDFLKTDTDELMAESQDGLKRVKDIVQSLKDFSHRGVSEWEFADIHQGLDSTLNIVNNEIKYKANVVKKYGILPPVKCIASQLNQVFMNLLVNAAHAIETRGVITISTGTENDQVWIEISDNGAGIPPENLMRIFDPFFTTKPIGSGTGLGLSLSYGIVSNHRGKIEVRSEVNIGTSFTIHLPINPIFAEMKED
jgi:two-component system, NtrC family, sensor kinase